MQGLQGHITLFGVEEAVKLGATGVHKSGHLVLRQFLLLHGFLDLPGDNFLNGGCTKFFEHAFPLEETVERRAMARVLFLLGHCSNSFMRCRARSRSSGVVFCVFFMNAWSAASTLSS